MQPFVRESANCVMFCVKVANCVFQNILYLNSLPDNNVMKSGSLP